VGAGARRIFTRYQGSAYPDQWRAYAFFDVSQFARVSATGNASYGDNVIFEENVAGRSLDLLLTATLRPFSPLKAEFSLIGNSIWRAADGSRFSDELIPRLRISTTRSCARAIAELRSSAGTMRRTT
jgi:hypothetical protein